MKIHISALDKIFSQYIRQRAGGKCEYCGQAKPLQCSHFHSRRKRSTRWDSDNAAAVDFTCHQYLGEHPNKHTEWFKKRLGTERFEQLNIRAETIVKHLDTDALMEKFKKLIEVSE